MLEGKSYLINFIQIQDFLISSSITEISKDADKADQNVKWFPKVPKTYILLWEAFFQFFFPKFIFTFTTETFFAFPIHPLI